jgi:hypothetical protein
LDTVSLHLGDGKINFLLRNNRKIKFCCGIVVK